uniref:RTJK n=1 Tax=Hirondellea gigas TaxID=1518452 RepID=A0A6A7FQF0_9CRUS
MAKLEAHGINSNVTTWIRNWLSNRKQRVCINQAKSEWVSVKSGVPQGSLLGPLLFIIYINDIDTDIVSKISKFADDTKLCSKGIKDTDRQSLQNDLHKLMDWADKWQMSFNVDKCTVLHIGCHNRRYDYQMGNNALTEVEQQRDLGIIINQDLKWNKQVNTSYNKANKVLGFIFRNLHYKSQEIMLPLYTALVRPHLEYAVQFWSPHL